MLPFLPLQYGGCTSTCATHIVQPLKLGSDPIWQGYLLRYNKLTNKLDHLSSWRIQMKRRNLWIPFKFSVCHVLYDCQVTYRPPKKVFLLAPLTDAWPNQWNDLFLNQSNVWTKRLTWHDLGLGVTSERPPRGTLLSPCLLALRGIMRWWLLTETTPHLQYVASPTPAGVLTLNPQQATAAPDRG